MQSFILIRLIWCSRKADCVKVIDVDKRGIRSVVKPADNTALNGGAKMGHVGLSVDRFH